MVVVCGVEIHFIDLKEHIVLTCTLRHALRSKYTLVCHYTYGEKMAGGFLKEGYTSSWYAPGAPDSFRQVCALLKGIHVYMSKPSSREK